MTQYIDDIRKESERLAGELKSIEVSHLHILLAIIGMKGRGKEILEKEGVDTDALHEIILNYRDSEEMPIASIGSSAIVDSIFNNSNGLITKYGDRSSAECLIVSLTREPGFNSHPLIQAIGIQWEEIGENLRFRFDRRDARHSRWEQALISDPGLHSAAVHKMFSADALGVLKSLFAKKRDAGGGDIRITDALIELLEKDETAILRDVLQQAGVEFSKLQDIGAAVNPDAGSIAADGGVGFDPFLLKGLHEAVNFLSAFPSEKVELHHLFMGLLKAAQYDHAGAAAVLPEKNYPFYQYAVMELIHIRRDVGKLAEDTVPDDDVHQLLSAEQIDRFRVIPIRIEKDVLILAAPGYIAEEPRKQISKELKMPIDIRLIPAGWFLDNRG